MNEGGGVGGRGMGVLGMVVVLIWFGVGWVCCLICCQDVNIMGWLLLTVDLHLDSIQ